MNHMFNTKMGVALAPASQTAAATRSANIDCIGADHVTIKLNLAARVNTSANPPTVALLESDDTTATNFATWSSTFSATKSLANAHQEIFAIDTRARKRYIQVKITADTHTTNDIVTASADYILSRIEQKAAGTAGMIASTNDAVTVG